MTISAKCVERTGEDPIRLTERIPGMTDGIALPTGFRAAGLACGIKDDPSTLDLALFVSNNPCSAAGVFTQNRICGAPVEVSRSRVPTARARAVVINSGNANACTGVRGIEDAQRMAALVAQSLHCATKDVLVLSTGVIGHYLPMSKVEAGISSIVQNLDSTEDAFTDAARGMMTTDTVHKQAGRQAVIGGQLISVGGVCKGAAMIGPNMATMLAVIMTDAPLAPSDADAILRDAVNCSFNCISVEGHTSTSDSVVLLANGTAGADPLANDDDKTQLQNMLNEVTTELAQAIIRDAEGAKHFTTIDVRGLRSRDEAFRIAKTVAEDTLVKTAIAGADPNWGRIVSCVGRTGVELSHTDVSLHINGTPIFSKGIPLDYDAPEVSKQMRQQRDVHIKLEFPFGDGQVRFWTSDLTTEYVRLNSEYTT